MKRYKEENPDWFKVAVTIVAGIAMAAGLIWECAKPSAPRDASGRRLDTWEVGGK